MNKTLYELTKPQKSIWLTEQFYKNTSINNISGTLTINQEVNGALLEQAIKIFISSNDALKLRLDLSKDEPMQYISDKEEYNIKHVEVNNEDELKKVSEEFASTPFNLDNSFLYEFIIFKFKDGTKGGFLPKLHHLISDAWSMSILINEIIDIYDDLLNGKEINEQYESYLDYIASEKEYLESDKYNKNKEFWMDTFNSTPELTSLSKKYNNDSDNLTTAHRKLFTLSEQTTSTIKEFCKANKTSPYTFFMAIVGLYTGKIGNTNSFILGTPVLNRKNYKEKNTVGMFISTIPFKMDIDYTTNFTNFLLEASTQQLRYFKNQKYPYDDLLSDIRSKYDITNNLYTTVLSYQNAKDNSKTSTIPYHTAWDFNGNISDELEIHISDLDDNNTFNLMFDYNISKFNENEIIELKNRLIYIINQVLENPEILLSDIEITTPEEREMLLTTLNNTQKDYPQDKNIMEIFYENVIKYPNQIAVVYENDSITYKDLYKKICAIENKLLKSNVKFQDIVAVHMPKSIDYIASILAILKMGAIYLPVSYDYPLNRIKYMLENSRAKLIISKIPDDNTFDTQRIYTSNISEDVTEVLPPKHFDITNSAYVIYTSGSTGQPKGVEISQKALINHVYSVYNRYNTGFSTKDVALSFANISFDANVSEVFVPICFGCTLHLISDDSIYNPEKIANYIHDNNITYTFLSPTIINGVYEGLKKFNDIKLNKLWAGAQSIKNTIYNKFLELIPNLEIINAYGPTEATVYCLAKNYNKIDNNGTFYVPIGTPMDNCQIHILNNTLTLQPMGYIGEICVSGACLAEGYLYNAEKTEKSFVNCKSLGKKIYRTGDYGYYLPNGDISYVGRIDMQVKLNGYRIELSEIDEVIYKFSHNIENSTSLIYNNKIYTFLVANNIDHTSLKRYLKSNLPYYMVPVKFVDLQSVPSTQNGKLDKKYLTEFLQDVLSKEEKNMVHPSNQVEKKLVKILSEILSITEDNISVMDNFFEIGGDSLSAIRVCTSVQNEFGKELSIKMLFDLDSIRDIAKYLSSESDSTKYKIRKLENLDKYPISSAQKRVYLSSQMAKEEKLLYNMPGIIRLPNNINITRLENALNKLIEINESLRTYFVKDTDGIFQKVLPSAIIKIIEKFINTDELEDYISKFPKEFDLSQAPLLRCEVISTEDNNKYLLIDMHHIISDGFSTGIIVKELSNLYNGNSVENKEFTYTDYSLWENDAIANNAFCDEKEFWKSSLKGIEPLNLPTDFPRPNLQSYVGNKYTNIINADLLEKIKAYCTRQNITLYMYLMGSFNILMRNFCRQDDVIVGTPVANRNLTEISDIIGMFVNTLAIHTKVDPELSIKKYFENFKNNMVDCFENQIYPYNELTNDIKIKNLVNAVFTYQNIGIQNICFDNFETSIEPIFTNISKFDLTVEVTPVEDKLQVVFEYCTDLFKQSTIVSLFNAYTCILKYIVENEDAKISDVELTTLEENSLIINKFNNTDTKYPGDKDIYSIFLEYVKNTPDNVAVYFEGNSLTYSELNKKVCELALVMKNNGISTGDIVAILIDKSIESIIAIFAILKLGATFLPIDTEYPTERIDYMLIDSKATLLLTTNEFLNKPTVIIRTLNISLDNTVIYNNQAVTGNNKKFSTEIPSHIMYTSGSTGKPKGTIIKQKGVIRLVKNTNYIDFMPDDRVLHAGSIGFDASTFEIFGALLNGLPLYIIKKEDLLNSESFENFISTNKVTVMLLTPSLVNQLCEISPHIFNGVRTLVTGGDVLSPKHINMLKSANPNLIIVDAYGPTENTTISTTFTIDKFYESSIPIGKPIANSTAYIVSTSDKLLPIGFPGELWVGGDGVAQGYLNNPSLSAEKFIPNPFGNGIAYKTGDLAKWMPDGNIEFMGRIDSQVKIRGFRIELKEIDIKLATHPDIKEAYSIVSTINNEKCICTYIVSDVDLDIKDLQSFLKTSLPKYMVPKYIVQLDCLPLNTNGKVDKHQLPSPINNEGEREIVKPTNKTEEILLSIFEKVLNKTNISTTDDFFEIGGDSLGAMKIQIEALSNDIKIEYADLFVHSTVKDLAKHINNPHTVQSTDTTDVSDSDKSRYLSYNSFLKRNNINNIKKVKYESLGNILLTGFTGFLGAHILDSFIKKEKGNIYCLIRDKESIPAMQRLKNTLHFYFEERYDKYIGNRIQLVNGDIAYENLGLSPEEYKALGENISTVIHSAALVKHYGTFREFEAINIMGTKSIVDFCTEFNLKMMHISTISVSGNVLAEEANIKHKFTEDRDYDETNFYIDQNIENVYVNSKFKGEDIVLEAISNGLQAYIIRMGNLTSRFSEGKFQQNHFENAFVNRIKSILQIGCMPDYLLDGYVEFTPIDSCGDAIIDLATHYDKEYSVFHLLNDNHVQMDRLYDELQKIGIPLGIVSSEKFKEIVNELLKDDTKKDYLQGIINDFDENQKLVFESNVKIKSNFTKEFLKEIGFNWPYIDTKYLKNYFKYLADIGYFNIKI